MSDQAASGTQGVASLFSRGRLTAIPRKAARRKQLLVHLAETLFERDPEYSEREVNEALLTVHEDCSALRRYLVVAGLLARTKDGRATGGPGSAWSAGPGAPVAPASARRDFDDRL